ncbi:hypothetical protein HDU77_007831 [Chytriomyces hyalinus]|nr:hypothetical protein HDU77_007831 [Chytriomyces hyalinus]
MRDQITELENEVDRLQQTVIDRKRAKNELLEEIDDGSIRVVAIQNEMNQYKKENERVSCIYLMGARVLGAKEVKNMEYPICMEVAQIGPFNSNQFANASTAFQRFCVSATVAADR